MKAEVIAKTFGVLEVNGYVTAANVSDFQEQLSELINDREHRTFLVDMSRVEFLDSAGLMALVNAFQQAAGQGKSLNICSIPPSVKIIFELTRLDKVLAIFDSRRDFEESSDLELAA